MDFTTPGGVQNSCDEPFFSPHNSGCTPNICGLNGQGVTDFGEWRYYGNFCSQCCVEGDPGSGSAAGDGGGGGGPTWRRKDWDPNTITFEGTDGRSLDTWCTNALGDDTCQEFCTQNDLPNPVCAACCEQGR